MNFFMRLGKTRIVISFTSMTNKQLKPVLKTKFNKNVKLWHVLLKGSCLKTCSSDETLKRYNLPKGINTNNFLMANTDENIMGYY